MPKNTEEKNTKGKKTVTGKTASKKTTAPSKKSVSAKKTEKVVKKPEVKKETTVVKEVEKVEKVEKVETVKPQKRLEKKGQFNDIIEKVTEDTPLVIALCVILILIALLIFVSCNKRIPKTSKGEEIVATIKGKTFTADDLYQGLKEKYGTDALINLIDEYITEKEVTITKEDKEYVQEVVDYYKNYADYYKVDLATFLSNYMGLSGISDEDGFYDFVMKDYKKSLAVQKFIGDNAKEEDLKKYYKENYSDSLTVKHILIQVDSSNEDSDAADKEAYNKAVEVINKLNDTDSDNLNSKFDELAQEYSDDTATYSNGGLIENVTKTSVEESFFNAANSLKDGKYTDKPVKTSYGYHVILRISSTKAKEYKEIKDEVKLAYAKSLLSADSSLQVTKWDELRKQYKLSIKDDNIKELYEKVIKDAKNSKNENSENSESSEN